MADAEKPVVAYLGPKASYTHQAALQTFSPKTHTLTPLPTISDVFTAVQSRAALHGLVPFENSTNGAVVFTLDLFADPPHVHPDILVRAETYVRVQHCLLGYLVGTQGGVAAGDVAAAEDTAPTTQLDFSHIKTLYSHPQAWGQCTAFLDRHFKGVERVDVGSTARAAEMVREAGVGGGVAAVSSAVAAGEYGVPVLVRGIETRGDNETRFFVIGKRGGGEAEKKGEGEGEAEKKEEGEGEAEKKGQEAQRKASKTLVSFTVDHENPGALASSLDVLKRYGLNLTSINSRPCGVGKWNYIFFVEFRGRREEGEGGKVNAALRELGSVCKGWRWLGSWEDGGEEQMEG